MLTWVAVHRIHGHRDHSRRFAPQELRLRFKTNNIVCDLAVGKKKAAMDKFMKEGFKYFPMRIASILVIEPGKILEVLLKIAKFFVKKKLLARVETLSKAELQSRVAPAELLPEFGGTSTFDYAQLIAQIRAQEGTAPPAGPLSVSVPPTANVSTPTGSPPASPSAAPASPMPVSPSESLLPHAH